MLFHDEVAVPISYRAFAVGFNPPENEDKPLTSSAPTVSKPVSVRTSDVEKLPLLK